MKTQNIIVAATFGLIAAIIIYAPAVTGGLGVVTATFASLPISISTLGFGTTAGIISGAVALVAIIALNGGGNLADIIIGPVIIVIAPAIWFGHLAGLARNTQGGQEWFPIQKIITRIALVTFAVTIFFGVVNQYDSQTIQNIIDNAYQNILQQSQLSQTEIQNIASQTSRIIPVFTPAIIATIFMLNLWLGSIIARKQNWMIRPKDNIPNDAKIEQFAIPLFVVAVALSFVEPISIVAKVMIGAVGTMFFLIGLATIHSITIGNQFRAPILTATYFAIFIAVIIEPVIPSTIIVTIGITETAINLRQKLKQTRT